MILSTLAGRSDWEIVCLFSIIYLSIQFLLVLFFLCLLSFCTKERICLFGFGLEKVSRIFDFDFDEWLNCRRFFNHYRDFFHDHSLNKILILGQFARTTNNWCTHDLSKTYVYCAFNLYVKSEHIRLAVDIRVT